MTQSHRPSALETTFGDLVHTLSTVNSQSYEDLRWAFYQRMLTQRHLIAAAAGLPPVWYDDIDFDDVAQLLSNRLTNADLTLTERAEVMAAQTALHAIRQERPDDEPHSNTHNSGWLDWRR